MKRKIITDIITFISVFFNTISSYSQENLKISPSVQLQYFKDNDENSILENYSDITRGTGWRLPLKDMKITFYSGTAKKTRLAEIMTDDKGVAIYNLKHESDFLTDNNGLWPFRSEFDGNDTIESGISELLIQDVTLNMTLTEMDSIKQSW